MRYTWHQFRTHLRLARKRAAERRLEELVVMNRAFNGGETATALQKQLLAELKDAERVD